MALRKFAKDHIELLFSVAALVTAVAAVFIAMEQTKVMREEAALERERHKIAVMPSVWMSTFINSNDQGDGEFKLVFSNRGLGPAVIERFVVRVDGKDAKNWDQLAVMMSNKYAPEVSMDGRFIRSNRAPISAGMFLEAGHSTSPFSFTSREQEDLYKMVAENFYKLDVSLCYCALYGSCYVTSLFSRPQEIKQCTAEVKPFISHAFVKQ